MTKAANRLGKQYETVVWEMSWDGACAVKNAVCQRVYVLDAAAPEKLQEVSQGNA